jgi:CheY-like chemotaxis protein
MRARLEVFSLGLWMTTPPMRNSMRRLIRSFGLMVEAFASGREFLDSGYLTEAACLVLDLRMPGMDGLEHRPERRLQPLYLAAERFWGELIDQLGMLARVEHASVAKQLEPGAMRVVHHEKGHPIGNVEIARANKLAVALEIREADQIRPSTFTNPDGPPRCCR